MEERKSLNSDYFKKVYDANEDPWNFKSSEYEAEKYLATLAALPKNQFENALEIGCSIGVLTNLLSKKCGHLLATDVSQFAIEQARIQCNGLDNVSFQCINFSIELPEEKFDLIMISEVAYYLSIIDWESATLNLFDRLAQKGNIVLVHWLPVVHDYPQTGDQVHDSFEKLMKDKLENVFSSRAEKYRIDVWQK